MVQETFNINFIIQILPKIIKALPLTLIMAFGAIFFGCAVGLLLTFAKISKYKVLRGVVDLITVIIRAIPEVVLVYLVYFGLPNVVLAITGYDINVWEKPVFVIIALAIAQAAASSELFRSAYNSLDKGQLEAAHAVGMSSLQKFNRIILPQGLYVILPNLMGLCVGIIQGTALAYTLGIMDVMGKAKVLDSNSFSMNTFEAYTLVAVIYWLISLVTTWAFKKAEEKAGKGMKTVASTT